MPDRSDRADRSGRRDVGSDVAGAQLLGAESADAERAGTERADGWGVDATLLEAVLRTADDTRAAGALVASRLQAGDVVVLVGELGAGKTTWTQGLAEGLQVRGPITSPTFVISRVHPSLVKGPDLVHVDAYRLGGAAELEDIDLDESVSGSVTVVEWGAGVAEHLSDSWLAVELVRSLGADDPDSDAAADHDDPRTIRVIGHGARWAGEPPLSVG